MYSTGRAAQHGDVGADRGCQRFATTGRQQFSRSRIRNPYLAMTFNHRALEGIFSDEELTRRRPAGALRGFASHARRHRLTIGVQLHFRVTAAARTATTKMPGERIDFARHAPFA